MFSVQRKYFTLSSPKHVYLPLLDIIQGNPFTSLYYSVHRKIFTSLSNPELLLAVPAVTFDLTGSEVKVELLLTPDVLVVVNFEEDAQQQALTLSELECRRSYEDDDGKVVLQWRDQFYGASSGEVILCSFFPHLPVVKIPIVNVFNPIIC